MIIAERHCGTTTTITESAKRGLLVSVPSAIHSHKPSPLPVFKKLYGNDIIGGYYYSDNDHHNHNYNFNHNNNNHIHINYHHQKRSLRPTSSSSSSSSLCQKNDIHHHHHRSWPKYQPDQLMNYHLATEEVISPLIGVELFARYLHTGFHSIGHECIKLQNETLYTWTEVIVDV